MCESAFAHWAILGPFGFFWVLLGPSGSWPLLSLTSPYLALLGLAYPAFNLCIIIIMFIILQRPISGVFGVMFLSVALWPMYFITVPKDGILGGISLGPNGRYNNLET